MNYLSPDQCAERAGLSRKVIYRAIEDGELQAFKPRNRLRVPEDEFERFMRANPVVPTERPNVEQISRRPSQRGSFRANLAAVEGGRR